MRRILMGLLGLMLMFVVSGCGITTALDTYSFGNKVVNIGASEIIVPTPFDLGKLANPTITDDGYPITVYQNGDANFITTIKAMTAAPGKRLPTPLARAEYSRDHEYKHYFGDSLQWENTAITLDGVPAVESTGLYTVKNKQIRFLQYTFISNGVLWNIAYQYAADSTVGAEALKLVEGKIQIIKKEG